MSEVPQYFNDHSRGVKPLGGVGGVRDPQVWGET